MTLDEMVEQNNLIIRVTVGLNQYIRRPKSEGPNSWNTVWEACDNGAYCVFLMSTDIDELIALDQLTRAQDREMCELWARAFELRRDPSIEIIMRFDKVNKQPYIAIYPFKLKEEENEIKE